MKKRTPIKCLLGFHAWGLMHYMHDEGPVYPRTQPARRCANCNREEYLDVSKAQNFTEDTWIAEEEYLDSLELPERYRKNNDSVK